jgi:hypothetical protein
VLLRRRWRPRHRRAALLAGRRGRRSLRPHLYRRRRQQPHPRALARWLDRDRCRQRLSRLPGRRRPRHRYQFEPARKRGVDAAANLYIADTGNYRIRKVSPDGTISTVAGSGAPGLSGDGGPATSAKLVYPVGVKVDSAGNLYIADGVAVRVVSASGLISTIAGNGTLGTSGDGGPSSGAQIGAWGLTVDSSGAIFVADPWDYLIRKLTPAKAR